MEPIFLTNFHKQSKAFHLTSLKGASACSNWLSQNCSSISERLEKFKLKRENDKSVTFEQLSWIKWHRVFCFFEIPKDSSKTGGRPPKAAICLHSLLASIVVGESVERGKNSVLSIFLSLAWENPDLRSAPWKLFSTNVRLFVFFILFFLEEHCRIWRRDARKTPSLRAGVFLKSGLKLS